MQILRSTQANTIKRLEEGGNYPLWVLVAALVGMFATTFPVTILTVSLGPIADELGSTKTTMAWLLTAPLLFSAISLPILGKLGDQNGHRKVFLLGFLLATFFSFFSAFAWDGPSLITLRTFGAITGAATQPSAMALIFYVYPPEKRTSAMGWWSMVTAASPAIGLIAGGPLVDLLGWRIVFLIQGSLSFIACVFAFFVLRETPTRSVKFDFPGALTLATCVAALMIALSEFPHRGLYSPLILISLATGMIFLVLFIAVERKSKNPLLPLSFFANRNFTAPILSNTFMGAAYMGAFVVFPIVLLDLFRFSLTEAAWFLLQRTLAFMLSSPIGGKIGERVGQKTASVMGAILITLSAILIAYGIGGDSLTLMSAGLIAQGIGFGFSQPSLNASVASSVPESDLGVAAASNRLMHQIGASFGITLLTMIAANAVNAEVFQHTFFVAAILGVASLAGALMMKSLMK